MTSAKYRDIRVAEMRRQGVYWHDIAREFGVNVRTLQKRNDDMKERNERTSAPVAKLAARLLAMSDYYLDVWINADPEKTRKAIRSLCAALVTQRPDKKDGVTGVINAEDIKKYESAARVLRRKP